MASRSCVASHTSLLTGTAEEDCEDAVCDLLPHSCPLRRGLLGTDVTISLLLCLCTHVFIHKQQLSSCWSFNGKKTPCSSAICFLFLVLSHGGPGGSAPPLLSMMKGEAGCRHCLWHLCPTNFCAPASLLNVPSAASV